MKQEVYLIEGMHCAACSSAVERVTRKLPFIAQKEQKARESGDDEQTAFRHERNNIIAELILSGILLYVSMGAMMLGAPLPGLISMKRKLCLRAFASVCRSRSARGMTIHSDRGASSPAPISERPWPNMGPSRA